MNIHSHLFGQAQASGRKTPLLLTVSETVDAGALTRTMHLDGERSIYFRVSSPIALPALQTWDFAVVAAIFTAMRQGRPLHVAGPVSASLLANIEEFQEVWASWFPKRYSVVPVTAESEIEPPATAHDKGVFAFSGGVDATYSLLRHVRRQAGRRNVEPVTTVLIHGFDIGLESRSGFETALAGARAMTARLDVPVSSVETNWRRDLCYDWEMEHGAGIMACLAQFSGIAGVAVVGGDEGYEMIDIPWGSNPVSSPLLSSRAFGLRLEGMGSTRTERVAFILDNSDLAPQLRVCWEEGRTGLNCGRCEKCIRTQVNILAAGGKPEAFVRNAGFAHIAWYPSKSIRDNYFLKEALRFASGRGIGGRWRLAVRIAIVKNAIFLPWTQSVSRLKNRIRENEALYFRLRKMVKGHG